MLSSSTAKYEMAITVPKHRFISLLHYVTAPLGKNLAAVELENCELRDHLRSLKTQLREEGIAFDTAGDGAGAGME